MEPDPVPCQGPLRCSGSAWEVHSLPHWLYEPKVLLVTQRLYECMEVLTHWLTRREGRHGSGGELEQGLLQ